MGFQRLEISGIVQTVHGPSGIVRWMQKMYVGAQRVWVISHLPLILDSVYRSFVYSMYSCVMRAILCCLVVASGCMSGHALSLSGNRKLMGLFDGWTKDVSKPSYTRETTYHGIGGDKTVEKTAVYTGSTRDEKTGEKTRYKATASGSASGDGSTTSVSIVSGTIDCKDEIKDAPAGIDCLKTDVSAVGTDSVSATINQEQAYQGPNGDATASVDVNGSLDSDGSVLNSLDAFAITAATADDNGSGLAAAGGNVTFTGDVANSQASISSQTTVNGEI